MALLDPILAGVVSSTEGDGLGRPHVAGPGPARPISKAKYRVAGRENQRSISTQVTYSMPEAVLNVKNNRFRASNVPTFRTPGANRGRVRFRT